MSEVLSTSNGEEALVWKVHLGADQAQKRLVVLAIALLGGTLGVLILRMPLAGLVGFGAVIAATGELFFPIQYRLDCKGASRRCFLSLTQVEWQAVQHLEETDGGIKLHTSNPEGRLAAFRGVELRFAGNRDEVLAKIHAHWKRDAEFLGTGAEQRAGRGATDSGSHGH